MADTSTSKSRVLLGTITSAHGIRGEVTIKTYTGDPQAISGYGPLTDTSGARKIKIRSVRVTPKGIIARLEGIDDRNGAEALRGTDLYVDRTRLPKPAQDEFYHADLIGLEVRDAGGAVLGKVVTVANFGAGDLLEIKRPENRETDYVAFTNANVPEIAIAQGYLVISMPDMVGEPEPASEEDLGGGEDSETEDEAR